MGVRDADIDTVQLVPDTVWMYNLKEEKVFFNELKENEKEVFLFTINSLTLDQKIETNWKNGLKMEVVLKRSIQAELIMTYLPSLGLLVFTFITTKFKREYFEAVVGVNLTLMLLLFTIFTTKISELPPTSYIKMIDIWLILCMLVPFTEVVLITFIEHYREENDKDKDQTAALTGEGETKEGSKIIESGRSNQVSPSPSSSKVTTIQVCEEKEGEKDGEKTSPKKNPLKAVFAWVTGWTRAGWSRERKLEVVQRIGRTQ